MPESAFHSPALAAVLAAAVVVVCILLVLQLWTRRQLRALFERIDQLELLARDRRPGQAPPEPPIIPEENPPYGFKPPREPSRDVLAGRTSFVRRAVSAEPDHPLSLAMLAIRAIDARIEENLSPTELAQDLNVSLRTLERGLASEIGCSPRELILVMKMREAGRLLASGDYRVNEVASRLGFTTHSHFTRCFRTFYRVPPSALARRPRT